MWSPLSPLGPLCALSTAILRLFQSQRSKSVALAGTSPTLPCVVQSSILEFYALPKIISAVRMSLRAMRSRRSVIPLSPCALFDAPTCRARKSHDTRPTATVDNLPYNRVFMPVGTEAKRVTFCWRCGWQRLGRDNWQRLNVGRDIKNRLGVPAFAVLNNSRSLKVVWTDAVAYAAKVINFIAVWYVAHLILVSKAVSGRLRPTPTFSLDGERAVAVITSAASPQPATGRVWLYTNPKTSLYSTLNFLRVRIGISQGVNLQRLGLALVRPAQSLQRLRGPFCILPQKRMTLCLIGV